MNDEVPQFESQQKYRSINRSTKELGKELGRWVLTDPDRLSYRQLTWLL